MRIVNIYKMKKRWLYLKGLGSKPMKFIERQKNLGGLSAQCNKIVPKALFRLGT